MKRIFRHFLLLILALTIVFGLSITANAAWTDDSLPDEDMKTLMNAQALHPQPSGYRELDNLIAEILKPYEDSDTYTKIYALYDWTVRNITYSWEGYSQQWAPCYDKFTLNYLDQLTYTEGLQEAIPQEIVNRSYHAIAKHKGICYDWGALMAVMARYVGLESYVHTGYFVFEATGGWGHHGWCEILLDGKNYIFDPQRDYRWTLNGTDKERSLYYFGIPVDGTKNHRYTILLDTAANAARDAQFLPVTATRGGISADGHFIDVPKDAWYESYITAAVEKGITKGIDTLHFDPDGTFTRAMVVEMLARIDGADIASAAPCGYTDVNQAQWYADAVNWATEQDIVNGIGDNKFAPEQVITRQEFVTILGRYLEHHKGISLSSSDITFEDSDQIADFAREWVGKAVKLGLVEGYPDGTFGPTDQSTRAVGATIMVRLDNYLKAA